MRVFDKSDDRDWVLMGLLAVLNLGSLLTTMLGASELLPEPMSYILGFAVQVMLFTLLAGFAGSHAPLRKWLAVAVFASACVYCSFFAYYGQLQEGEEQHRQLALAETRHAELVKAVYSEAKLEGEGLAREAQELDRQATEEAARGSTTGTVGYGPRAKEMREKANEASLVAERHQASVERLAPLFEFDPNGLSPKEIHSKDVAAWQAAPPEWTQGVPQPDYKAYVDVMSQVPFLAPIHRVQEGDPVAMVALLLAMLVDGMAILLGTAIDKGRGQRSLEEVLGSGILNFRNLVKVVREAFATPEEAIAHPRAIRLMLRGPAAPFLRAFEEGIHEENGAIVMGTAAPDESHRENWDILVTRLEELHWLEFDADGARVVQHQRFKQWLVERIRDEERTDVHVGPEAPHRLVLDDLPSP
jgi:hypothetical protein